MKTVQTVQTGPSFNQSPVENQTLLIFFVLQKLKLCFENLCILANEVVSKQGLVKFVMYM